MWSQLRSSKGGVPSRVLGGELRQLWQEQGPPEPRGGEGRAGVSAGVCAGGGRALPLAVGGGKQRIRQPRRPSGEDGRDTVDHTGQQRSRNSQRS